uniref:Uncharacterized protein n=1 Tax=Lactuca sativa TaxID=4236 RepID=A0A9R1UWI1_LACSA|nr:hypothetical protein LSAT_V11C800419330 [Lactuca sativa]
MNSLRYLMDQPNLNTRQRRWPDVVNGCDYEILYHMGKAHMVADSWTRRVIITEKRRLDYTLRLADFQISEQFEDVWTWEGRKGIGKGRCEASS